MIRGSSKLLSSEIPFLCQSLDLNVTCFSSDVNSLTRLLKKCETEINYSNLKSMP